MFWLNVDIIASTHAFIYMSHETLKKKLKFFHRINLLISEPHYISVYHFKPQKEEKEIRIFFPWKYYTLMMGWWFIHRITDQYQTIEVKMKKKSFYETFNNSPRLYAQIFTLVWYLPNKNHGKSKHCSSSKIMFIYTNSKCP